MKDIYSKVLDFINNIKNNRYVIFGIISVFGLIFIISFVFSIINICDFFSKVHSSKANVISVEENSDVEFGSYNYEIEFYDKDDNYCVSSLDSNKVYDVGDKIKVYYKYSDEIYLERNNPIIILIPINCILIMFVLFIILKDTKVKIETVNKLITDNNIVYARITNITRKDVEDKKYYNIVCNWVNPNDNRSYTFVSEDLDFDPTVSINLTNKNGLNVYLDKNDFNHYLVDVKEIKDNKI